VDRFLLKEGLLPILGVLLEKSEQREAARVSPGVLEKSVAGMDLTGTAVVRRLFIMVTPA
jgi:hypothetical protein